jgi:hypothetical protein
MHAFLFCIHNLSASLLISDTILTNSTEWSPLSEANIRTSSRDFLRPFHQTLLFFTMFTWPRCWTLSWARWIQSTSSHTIYLRWILKLSSYLRLGLSSGLFPSGFPTKVVYSFLISPVHATCHAHPPWFDNSNNILWRVQLYMKLLIM